MSIINALEKLRKFGLIYFRRINPQLYEVHPNEESFLNVLKTDLDNLENFIVSITKRIDRRATRTYKGLSDENAKEMKLDIYTMYQHFLLTYIQYALISWPNKIKNQQMLAELYQTLFLRLKDIYLKLVGTPASPSYVDLSNTMVKNSFTLTPDKIQNILTHAEEHDVLVEFQEGLDIVWRPSIDLMPWAKGHFEKNREKQWEGADMSWKPNSWREALKYFNDQ